MNLAAPGILVGVLALSGVPLVVERRKSKDWPRFATRWRNVFAYVPIPKLLIPHMAEKAMRVKTQSLSPPQPQTPAPAHNVRGNAAGILGDADPELSSDAKRQRLGDVLAKTPLRGVATTAIQTTASTSLTAPANNEPTQEDRVIDLRLVSSQRALSAAQKRAQVHLTHLLVPFLAVYTLL